MKYRIITLATIAVLALAGCSSPAEPSPNPPLESAQPAPVETAKEPVVTEETPTPTPTPTGPVLNARGNIPKAIGETALLYDDTTGEKVTQYTFAVTAIEPNFQCTSGYADPPKNGHYIAVTIDLTTTPELAQNEWFQSVVLSEYNFTVFNADGIVENDSMGNGYMCLADAERFPSEVGPGQRAVGKIVLDTAVTTGAFVIADNTMTGGGWEYGF